MTISVNCEACGKVYSVKIEAAGSTFVCQACGSEVGVPGSNQPSNALIIRVPGGAEPTNVLAIVSLVLSSMSVFQICVGPCGPAIGFPLALAGAITGFIGLQKAKAGTASGKELAMGGMITGIVVIVLNILLVVLLLFIGGLALLDGSSK